MNIRTFSFPRQLCSPAFLLLYGAVLHIAAFVLLAGQVRSFRLLRADTIPAAAEVATLRDRVKILEQQIDTAEQQRLFRSGSHEELFSVRVVPSGSDLRDVVRLFEALAETLRKQKKLFAMAPLSFQEAESREVGEENVLAIPLSFWAELTEEGAMEFLSFLDLSGLISVGDALSEREQRALLLLTEQENPSALPALEQYLSVELHRYVLQSAPYDGQLQKAFPTGEFLAVLRGIIGASRVEQARQFLQSATGQFLLREQLWPTRFFTVERAVLQDAGRERVRLELVLRLYRRA